MNHDKLAEQIKKYFLIGEPIIDVLNEVERLVGMNYYDGEESVKANIQFQKDLTEINKLVSSLLPKNENRKNNKSENLKEIIDHLHTYQNDITIYFGSKELKIISPAVKLRLFMFLADFYGATPLKYGSKPKADVTLQKEVLYMIYWLINDGLRWKEHIDKNNKKAAFKIIFNYFISEVLHLKPISRQKFSEKYELLTKKPI